MKINLTTMSSENYKEYLSLAVPDYAKDKVEAGTWQTDEAEELSLQSFNNYLPDGVETANQYLFSIVDSAIEKIVGYLWIHLDKNGASPKIFVYDFIIFEEFRNKGYGKNSLTELEKYAKSIDVTEIGLHVFAHNKIALHTYEKNGFIPTDITMVKRIL